MHSPATFSAFSCYSQLFNSETIFPSMTTTCVVRDTCAHTWGHSPISCWLCGESCPSSYWTWDIAIGRSRGKHRLHRILSLVLCCAAVLCWTWFACAHDVSLSNECYTLLHRHFFSSPLYFEVACETVSWSLGVNVTSSRLFFYIFFLCM